MSIINHHAIVWSTTQTTIQFAGTTGAFPRYRDYTLTVPNVYRSNPVVVAHSSKIPSKTFINAFVNTTSQVRLYVQCDNNNTTSVIPEGRWILHIWRTSLQWKQPTFTTIT